MAVKAAFADKEGRYWYKESRMSHVANVQLSLGGLVREKSAIAAVEAEVMPINGGLIAGNDNWNLHILPVGLGSHKEKLWNE